MRETDVADTKAISINPFHRKRLIEHTSDYMQ